jgi:hypothetical protein
VTLDATDNQGDSNKSHSAKNLAMTRTLTVAAKELAPVVGRQPLGISLCVFGIAFAGLGVGLRDLAPQWFDLSILLAIFGFAALITLLGVLAAILRKEEIQQAMPTLTIGMIAMNSRSIRYLADELNITNDKVLESVCNASSLGDLWTRLQAAGANSSSAPPTDIGLLNDLDVVRVALDRAPLSRS